MTLYSFENAVFGNVTLDFKLEEGANLALAGLDETSTQNIIDAMLGFVPPGAGQLFVSGEPTVRFSNKRWRQFRGTVGVVSNRFGLVSNLKVWENVLLPVSFHSEISSINGQHSVVAKALDLSGFNGNPLAAVNTLSRLERKQILMARAFAMRPQLMIYDHYLDGHSYKEKQNLIRSVNQFTSRNENISCLYFVDETQDLTSAEHLHAVIVNQGGNYVH
mgnify:CR=1 FL=1